jgi:hypothetical protein
VTFTGTQSGCTINNTQNTSITFNPVDPCTNGNCTLNFATLPGILIDPKTCNVTPAPGPATQLSGTFTGDGANFSVPNPAGGNPFVGTVQNKVMTMTLTQSDNTGDSGTVTFTLTKQKQ